jgi:hypothetical protein
MSISISIAMLEEVELAAIAIAKREITFPEIELSMLRRWIEEEDM